MVLEMKKICKLFGPTYALKDVDFQVGEAEIHALMGENGAGKSTLMNILGGVLARSSGEIYFGGREVNYASAKKAQDDGIRFVHQELNMFNDLRVYENLFIGEEILNKAGILNRKEMIRQTEETLAKMNLDIGPKTLVGTLDASRKQLLEIAKAVRSNCKLIILDEPTSALTSKEIEILFETMRGLKEQGVSLIFISHKIPEIMEICEKFTVLRDGRLVGTGDIKDVNENQITDMLVGREMRRGEVVKKPVKPDPFLVAEGLTIEPHFHDISFTLNRGEVLAMTGLHGDGRGELAEALFGMRKLQKGTVTLEGKPINMKSVAGVMKSGVAMVQRNRKERSVIPDMSIIDNVSIANFIAKHKNPFISPKQERERFKKNQKITNIKTDNPRNPITSLSGGNQQKVILSRWLEIDAPVYILDNPTQGIDIGAKQEIYKLINKMAEEGKSIIVFSDEFPEIYQIADRAIIMYQGQIHAELNRDEMSGTVVMYYATGSNLVEGGSNNEI